MYHIKSNNEPIEIISRLPAGYYCVLSLMDKAIWYPDSWEIEPSPIEEPDPTDLIKRLKDPNYLLTTNRYGHVQRDLFIGALMWNSKLTETHKRLLKMYQSKEHN